MLLQSYFPFPVLNRKIIFSKKFSNFLRLRFASQRYLYLITVKLPKVRNNILEEMNPRVRLHCFKKHALSKNFHGNRKEE